MGSAGEVGAKKDRIHQEGGKAQSQAPPLSAPRARAAVLSVLGLGQPENFHSSPLGWRDGRATGWEERKGLSFGTHHLHVCPWIVLLKAHALETMSLGSVGLWPPSASQ